MKRLVATSALLTISVFLPRHALQAQTAVDFRQAVRSASPALANVEIRPAGQEAAFREEAPAEPQDAAQDEPEAPKDEDPIAGPRLEWLELGPQKFPPGMERFAAGPTDPTGGSAFAVDEDLLIAFVGNRPQSVSVIERSGKESEGEVIAMDYVTGLAVIRVDEGTFSPLVVGAAQTEPGLPVVATWLQEGQLHSDAGMVSTRPLPSDSRVGLTPQVRFMSDSQASGSAVLDSEGIVVGVLVPDGTGGMDCIPSASVLRLIDSANQNPPRDLKRGLIGIQFQAQGPLVMQVSPESAAARAGIEAGDVVERVGDTDVKGSRDVVAAVASARSGDTLEITVRHDGDSKTLQVVLTDHPQQRIVMSGNFDRDLARALGLQGAFELKDGKLVPIPGGQRDGRFDPGVEPELPVLPFGPRWGVPGPGRRGPIDGFQIERSGMEDTLKELQRQMEKLNEKLDQAPAE